MNIKIREIVSSDRTWVDQIIAGWGADFIVSRGRKLFPADLPGLIAETKSGERIGLATYEIVGDQCELVTLDAMNKFAGVGTRLLDEVTKAARQANCMRLWLITTNDNLDAIRFYQRRRMTIASIHINSLEQSRLLKRSIPLIGQHGIPLRDEIEFELLLSFDG